MIAGSEQMKERAGIIFGIGGSFLLVKPYFDMKEILPVFEKMIHECWPMLLVMIGMFLIKPSKKQMRRKR